MSARIEALLQARRRRREAARDGDDQRLGLSARAYARILKVSRTIADLDGRPEITAAQVAGGDPVPQLDRSIPLTALARAERGDGV